MTDSGTAHLFFNFISFHAFSLLFEIFPVGQIFGAGKSLPGLVGSGGHPVPELLLAMLEIWQTPGAQVPPLSVCHAHHGLHLLLLPKQDMILDQGVKARELQLVSQAGTNPINSKLGDGGLASGQYQVRLLLGSQSGGAGPKPEEATQPHSLFKMCFLTFLGQTLFSKGLLLFFSSHVFFLLCL